MPAKSHRLAPALSLSALLLLGMTADTLAAPPGKTVKKKPVAATSPLDMPLDDSAESETDTSSESTAEVEHKNPGSAPQADESQAHPGDDAPQPLESLEPDTLPERHADIHPPASNTGTPLDRMDPFGSGILQNF